MMSLLEQMNKPAGSRRKECNIKAEKCEAFEEACKKLDIKILDKTADKWEVSGYQVGCSDYDDPEYESGFTYMIKYP